VSSRIKIGIGALAIVSAVFLWYWSGRAERALVSESTAALEGVRQRIRCQSCGHEFDLAASEYAEQLNESGIRCTQCGQTSTTCIGDPSDIPPPEITAEVAAISSIDDLRLSVDEVARAIRELEERLQSSEVAGNSSREAELRRQLALLRLKYRALNDRWDELLTSG